MSSSAAVLSPISERRGRGRPRGDAAPDPAALLDAALVSFAEHGFAGANLRAIAATAGVNVALIARNYGSKFGLWKAAVDQISSRMRLAHARIAALHDDSAPIAVRLREAIDQFVLFSAGLPELGRFFSDEVARAGERRDYVIEHIWSVHRDSMLPLLREGKAAGIVPAATDPEFLFFMMIGAVSMPLMIRPVIEMELEGDLEDATVRLSRNVASLFLR